MRHIGRSVLAHQKWLGIFLVAVLGTLFLPVTASATEPTAVGIAAPSQPVDSGQQFTIEIEVVPGTPIAGVQFDLSFDPSLVAVESVQEGDLLGQGGASSFFNPGKIDNKAGTITGVFGAITTPGEAVSAEGTFATVTLTARAQRDNWPVGLSNVVAGDMGGNAVPITLASNGVLSPSVSADGAVFSWWVLSVIVGVALALIAATIAGLLLRRRQMMRALESAGRQDYEA